MKLAQQLALWADRLRDVSALGLYFAKNRYDRYHFGVVQDVAMQMMGVATDSPPDQLEPLRHSVFARPTPWVAVDAAIVDENGRILLIQRADSGRWAMPGGGVEVGETPAEAAVREAREETGVESEAVALVGVHDSRLCGTEFPHHLYHLLFLCRPLSELGEKRPSHANEVLDVQWFPGDDLPANLEPNHASRMPEAFRVWRGDPSAYFD